MVCHQHGKLGIFPHTLISLSLMIHLKRVTIWSLPFTLAAAVAMVDFVPLPWNDFPLQDFSITLNYYVWQTILFAYIKNTVQLNILLLFITVFSFILYFLCIEWYLLDVDVFLVYGGVFTLSVVCMATKVYV